MHHPRSSNSFSSWYPAFDMVLGHYSKHNMPGRCNHYLFHCRIHHGATPPPDTCRCDTEPSRMAMDCNTWQFFHTPYFLRTRFCSLSCSIKIPTVQTYWTCIHNAMVNSLFSCSRGGYTVPALVGVYCVNTIAALEKNEHLATYEKHCLSINDYASSLFHPLAFCVSYLVPVHV